MECRTRFVEKGSVNWGFEREQAVGSEQESAHKKPMKISI